MEPLNVDKLKQIRNRLPKGAGKEIARKTGLSGTLISRVLNGKANNIKILEAAYVIIESENRKYAALEAKHNAVISQ